MAPSVKDGVIGFRDRHVGHRGQVGEEGVDGDPHGGEVKGLGRGPAHLPVPQAELRVHRGCFLPVGRVGEGPGIGGVCLVRHGGGALDQSVPLGRRGIFFREIFLIVFGYLRSEISKIAIDHRVQ